MIVTSLLAFSTFACGISAAPDDGSASVESEVAMRPSDDTGSSRGSVIILHLTSYESFFTSPRSFDGSAGFGVTASSYESVSSSLELDSTLAPLASGHEEHFATLGIRLGELPATVPAEIVEAHERRQLWQPDAAGENLALTFDPNAVQLGEPAFDWVPKVEGDFTSLTESMKAASKLVADGKRLVIVNTSLVGVERVPSVIPHQDNWGSTGHTAAAKARWDMTTVARIVKPFLTPDLTFVIVGDTSHTPSGMGAPNVNATVIGPHVKSGTSFGRVDQAGRLPPLTPGVRQFWAYLAEVTHAPASFGTNAHTAVVMNEP